MMPRNFRFVFSLPLGICIYNLLRNLCFTRPYSVYLFAESLCSIANVHIYINKSFSLCEGMCVNSTCVHTSPKQCIELYWVQPNPWIVVWLSWYESHSICMVLLTYYTSDLLNVYNHIKKIFIKIIIIIIIIMILAWLTYRD